MRKGSWHQFGDRSQVLAQEQLEHGCGVGAIFSPRDLNVSAAKKYVTSYKLHLADILVDQQFFLPDSHIGKVKNWPLADYRLRISALTKLSNDDMDNITRELEAVNLDFSADAILAPAVLYIHGRDDVAEINLKLFECAKRAGDMLGIPTIGTIFLDQSVTTSLPAIMQTLSIATSVPADGWYFGFEFESARVPYNEEEIYRFCVCGLKLAATGKPVLQGYLGPLSLLAMAVGASGAGITHSQNMWGFSRTRWKEGKGGGDGRQPPRYFSPALWGTIVYPDEFSRVDPALLSHIVSNSPFAKSISDQRPFLDWNKWSANKHMLYKVGAAVDQLALKPLTERRNEVLGILERAIDFHAQIASSNVTLTDRTNIYQVPWRNALLRVFQDCSDDYDMIDLLNSI